MIIDYLFIATIILCNAFLGLLVIVKNKKDPKNLGFFALTVSIILWNLFAFLSDYLLGSEIRLLLSKLSYTFSFWSLYFALFFTYLFVKGEYKKKIIAINSVVALIFTGLIFLSGNIVNSVSSATGQFSINLGKYWPFFLMAISLYIFQMVLLPIFYYKKADRLKRNQMKFVLVGFALFAFTVVLFNFVIKAFIGTDSLYRYGNYSVIFLIGFTSYALIKHRLMDIRMVVARSVAYILLLAILAGFYGAAIVAAQSLIFPEATSSAGYVALQIALAVIMAFSFQPLRRWLTKVTDKIFFKNEYDPEQFLDTVSHTMGSTIVLVELMFKTLALIRSQIKVTRGVMVVLSDTGAIFNTQSFGYGGALQIDAEDMVKIGKDGALVLDELEEHSHFKRLLRKYDAAIAIPIKTDKSVEGVLLLGEKLSGDMYGAQDLRVFEIIAPELAVAITNAKSFEKIEKFNVTLRQEIKKATSELEKKNEQLRELDKAKDEFISMASHQLRTPLTAIKGYLSMLLEGDAGEIKVSQYDFVNEAFQGANRMVGLINDLLNVSRMETGRFFLEPVEVDLDKIIQEEMKQLQNHAKEKKLAFKYEKKGKVPKITADETKIRQVVMNFMDNAIYYTTKGGVTVTLRSDKTNVIYEVTDTGIGVPKAQQKNLFTKFYRADNARHVRPDGTGLGIYLAKRVLDDHGGQLIFHSKEGEGSTFGFKFPIHCKMTIKRASAPTPGAPGGPALGELAAGIGVNPAVLEATQSAGLEAPLCDSPDKKDLEKEVLEEAASK